MSLAGTRRVSGKCRSSERAKAAQLVQVEPDEERLADDVLVRDESPDAAVARVVPVVAHDEIVAGRHRADQAAAIVVAVLRMPEIHAAADESRRFLLQDDLVFAAVEGLEIAGEILQPLARPVI